MHTVNQQPLLAIEAPPQPLMIEASKVSTDLVPVSYDKQAWNELRSAMIPGVEPLPHHSGNLTSEQATRINEHYDIELNFGTHGFGLHSKPEGLLYSEGLPTQFEYEEVKKVINGLQEGDTLFLEGVGFSSNPQAPLTIRQLREAKAALDDLGSMEPKTWYEAAAVNAFKILGGSFLQMVGTVKIEQMMKDSLLAEQTRAGYLTSVWTYAAFMAKAKGINVRYADADYYDEMKLQERTGKSGSELMMSSDPVDQLHFYRNLKQRDKNARNIVKDFALDNLPSEGTPPPTGRKPKLAVLYGVFHKEHMVEQFKDLGLDVTVREMASSTQYERAREHIIRDLSPIFQKTIAALISTELWQDTWRQGIQAPENDQYANRSMR